MKIGGSTENHDENVAYCLIMYGENLWVSHVSLVLRRNGEKKMVMDNVIPVKVFVGTRSLKENELLENAQECAELSVESNEVRFL
uniref:DUF1738 domain-containing protein n=1 Tax=Angiostrongylus cantonensis TaxID=6313 RepID=A0A0K0D236_ANGCA